MARPTLRELSLTDADLDFLVSQAAPSAKDPDRLKLLVRQEESFRKALVGNDRVFQQVMNDEEVFVKVSPTLYFEVLLRRSLKELETATHTVERAGRQNIPVFDTREVVDLLTQPEVLLYLAHLLASFTRIHSYTTTVRVRRGIRHRVRFNDMDVDSLVRMSATVDEEQRFALYKRIADVCLFISGVFPDYTFFDYRYPMSGQRRPLTTGRLRRSLEEYESEGRRFYSLAQQHPTAQLLDLAPVFGLLKEHFNSARKPLTFIAAHYLHTRKHMLFAAQVPGT
ncbi:MAG: hypothetical protein HY680_03415 [Chloroflexi bacterium]|nr:hypothetical protein [Chloroflexota bacterium]